MQIFDTVKCRHCSVVYKIKESHNHICEGKKQEWLKTALIEIDEMSAEEFEYFLTSNT